MKPINILVLSVGRRVELIQAIKRNLRENKSPGKIIGADISVFAPALYECDLTVSLPSIGDEMYLAELEKIIKEYSINAIIPTIDTELSVLAENKDKLESKYNVMVFISNQSTIRIFQDKKKMYEYLLKYDIKTPKVFMDPIDFQSLRFPVFLKPSNGSSSVNASIIESHDDLVRRIKAIKKPIIQEFISGNEYTVDLYIDKSKRIISESHRQRLKTRSGEILIGRVTFVDKIHEMVVDIVKHFIFFGPVTLQFMENSNNFYLIEINPRLGGGVPMSIEAGIDISNNIIDEINKTRMSVKSSRGIEKVYSRFDQMIEVKNHD